MNRFMATVHFLVFATTAYGAYHNSPHPDRHIWWGVLASISLINVIRWDERESEIGYAINLTILYVIFGGDPEFQLWLRALWAVILFLTAKSIFERAR